MSKTVNVTGVKAETETAWSSIDSAPKDGTEILVLQDGEMFLVRWLHYYGHKHGRWDTQFTCADNGDFIIDKPTLWHPKPALPAK